MMSGRIIEYVSPTNIGKKTINVAVKCTDNDVSMSVNNQNSHVVKYYTDTRCTDTDTDTNFEIPVVKYYDDTIQ